MTDKKRFRYSKSPPPHLIVEHTSSTEEADKSQPKKSIPKKKSSSKTAPLQPDNEIKIILPDGIDTPIFYSDKENTFSSTDTLSELTEDFCPACPEPLKPKRFGRFVYAIFGAFLALFIGYLVCLIGRHFNFIPSFNTTTSIPSQQRIRNQKPQTLIQHMETLSNEIKEDVFRTKNLFHLFFNSTDESLKRSSATSSQNALAEKKFAKLETHNPKKTESLPAHLNNNPGDDTFRTQDLGPQSISELKNTPFLSSDLKSNTLSQDSTNFQPVALPHGTVNSLPNDLKGNVHYLDSVISENAAAKDQNHASVEGSFGTNDPITSIESQNLEKKTIGLNLRNLKKAISLEIPFTKELQAYGADRLDPDLLESLNRYAKTGLGSLSTLEKIFLKTGDKIVRASIKQPFEPMPFRFSNLIQIIKNTLRQLITVRSLKDTGKNTSADRVARMQTDLKNGDFEAFLMESKNLSPAAQKEAYDFVEDIQKRFKIIKWLKSEAS